MRTRARISFHCLALAAGLTGALVLAGCPKKGSDSGTGTMDSGPGTDAAASDAGSDAASLDGGTTAAERGAYIVNNLATCGGCHSPLDATGMPVPGMEFSGVTCLVDIDPDPALGCLSSRNLTNDATGLMNRTDQEIKDMFLDGMRPGGSFLVPVMPYWEFHNMTAADADAVVAYLRTIPGVPNTPPPNQPPWDVVPAPATPIDMVDVPAAPATPGADNGRYLASTLANCIECHTPELPPGDIRPIDMTKPFWGGRAFPAADFGLPVPPFPMIIYSMNLTQDATGIMGRTVPQIMAELQMGLDPGGNNICPPMPVGPFGFGGITDSDATDIANYILSLAPAVNAIPNGCSF
jgi:mono/diheme cytochrome c family protein